MNSSRGQHNVKLAIFEGENTKAVHWQDFAPAEATKATHTLLGGNEVWLLKQESIYALVKMLSFSAATFCSFFNFHDVCEDDCRSEVVRGAYFDESDRNLDSSRLSLSSFVVLYHK